jgi:hypothetical protein
MGLLKNVGSMGNQCTLGLAVMLGLLGCSKAATPNTGGGLAGTTGGAPGANTPAAGGMAGGAAKTTAGASGAAAPIASGAGGRASTGTAGTGEFGGMSGKTGGGSGTTGGGSGTTGGGSCDTSTFMQDCVQNGAAWGTPAQAGPCAAGTSIYGVHQKYGPYGVRSEYNVGSGAAGSDFNAAFPIGGCGVFISGFMADPIGSMDLMNVHDLNFDKFTVFYPGCMPDGEKFPLITWGNGTCAMPEGYGPLLRTVASYGYIIVAANDLATGAGASMMKGIDFMLAENEKADSKYYHHIDPDKIGAMGHSQGAGATVSAASADARIKAIIAFNSGTSSDKPFLNVSGDMDLGAGTDPSGSRNGTMGSAQPGAWLWMHQVPNDVNCKMAGDPKCSTTGTTAPGHLTLMMEPERLSEITVAWWDMLLKGKVEAKNMFIGASCKLCDGSAYPSMWGATGWRGLATPSLEFGHNDKLQ